MEISFQTNLCKVQMQMQEFNELLGKRLGRVNCYNALKYFDICLHLERNFVKWIEGGFTVNVIKLLLYPWLGTWVIILSFEYDHFKALYVDKVILSSGWKYHNLCNGLRHSMLQG